MGANRIEVFLTALRLGLTSFGGPFAHLGNFHAEYVTKKKWLTEDAYADLVALCQFMPGPTSSQVGIAVGVHRAGPWGGLFAWLGFTLPSALLMMLFAFWRQNPDLSLPGLVRGLELTAFAIVAQAVWAMRAKLAFGWRRGLVAFGSVVIIALIPGVWTQPLVLVLSGLVGWVLFRRDPFVVLAPPSDAPSRPLVFSLSALGLWAGLLVFLPLLALLLPSELTFLADAFYRAGSLVFGGGHVALPLLQVELVGPGHLTLEDFLAGYGAAQAVPGPLVSASVYWGWLIGGPWGGLVSLVMLFLPSALLLAAVLPWWSRLKSQPAVNRALAGVNAAVVGLLAWALWNPIGLHALLSPTDLVLAALLTTLAFSGRVSALALVIVGAGAGLLGYRFFPIGP